MLTSKFFFGLFLILMVNSLFAQNSIDEETHRVQKAEELLKKARSAVYSDRFDLNVESAKIVISGEGYTKTKIEIKGRAPVVGEIREKQMSSKKL